MRHVNANRVRKQILKAFRVSEFYIGDVLHEMERIYITIRNLSSQIFFDSLCLIDLLSDITLDKFLCIKTHFSTVMRMFGRTNKENMFVDKHTLLQVLNYLLCE